LFMHVNKYQEKDNMKKYHAVIFAGLVSRAYNRYRGARGHAAYRLRSAAAERGYNTRVLDFAWSLSVDRAMQVLEKFVTLDTKLIGISATFWQPWHWGQLPAVISEEFFDRVRTRWPHVKLVLGGPGSGMVQTQHLFDYHVKGYSDRIWPDLLAHVHGKPTFGLKFERLVEDGTQIVSCPPGSAGDSMDRLNTRFLPEDYIESWEPLPIEISRGCIFKCAFCSFQLNGKTKNDYVRPADLLLDELRYNQEHFGTTSYMFLDDTYNDSLYKLEEVGNAVKRLDFDISFSTFLRPELMVKWPEQIDMMIESGLEGGTVGLESLEPTSRSRVKKSSWVEPVLEACSRINKTSGIHASLIAGLPGDTRATLERDMAYMDTQDVFKSWIWVPLNIHNVENSDAASDMDKNPESYGYSVLPGGQRNNIVNWAINDIDFDYVSRIALANNRATAEKKLVAGWDVSGARALGFTKDEIDTMTWGYLDSHALERARAIAGKYYSKIISE